MSTITEQALEELSPFELSLFLEQKIHENKNVTNLLKLDEEILTGPLLIRGKPSFYLVNLPHRKHYMALAN